MTWLFGTSIVVAMRGNSTYTAAQHLKGKCDNWMRLRSTSSLGVSSRRTERSCSKLGFTLGFIFVAWVVCVVPAWWSWRDACVFWRRVRVCWLLARLVARGRVAAWWAASGTWRSERRCNPMSLLTQAELRHRWRSSAAFQLLKKNKEPSDLRESTFRDT